ncbi:MAG TPA: aspartate--tRNA(Asn) ligase [Candidatus Bathyarchaeia archaeon]|nr:aspartate--tRNA(Asn) ligase [Candidatus Bathyarchaeia archaeon]
MNRTLVLETIKKIGQQVRLCGWVNRRRDHGKLIFIDLRDRSGLVQIVGGKELGDLKPEYVVEIVGKVKRRLPKTVNPKIETGKIEIEVEKAKIIAQSDSLPFDIGREHLDLELPTLLDYRSLTLRHPKIKAIFHVQEVLIDAFRQKLKSLGFTEFQAPTIVPVATEGGAEIFPVKYYDHTVYLSQSPQLYKQILVSIFERGFTIGRAYRAEPSVTTRHLTEYISLDCEFGFIDSWTQLMDAAEDVVRFLIGQVEEKCPAELKLYQVKVPQFGKQVPRIRLQEALEIIYKRTGRDSRNEPDLAPEDEREICRWSRDEFGSDFVFVTHYPTKKRPFYTFPDPENREETLSFDLIGTGFEWITGGQRINDYDQLVTNIKKWGNDPDDFEVYLQAFKYGMPPEGGFAIGAERVTQGILGLENIREASLFPRDMERVDIRLSTLKVTKKPAAQSLFKTLVRLLKDNQVKYQLYRHKPVYTSRQAAEARGTKIEQGAKALVVLADKKPVLAVFSAAGELDIPKFRKLLKVRELKLAQAGQVKQITGVDVGAVPPFGSLLGLITYVDQDLAESKEIAFNAGSRSRSIKIAYNDFCLLAKPNFGRFMKK